MKGLIDSSIEPILGAQVYAPKKVGDWTSAIVEQVLKLLQAANKPFKYVVTCIIMQKNGAGLHTASTCFWDTKSDGQRMTRTRTSQHSEMGKAGVQRLDEFSRRCVFVFLATFFFCRLVQRALGQCHDACDRHRVRAAHLSGPARSQAEADCPTGSLSSDVGASACSRAHIHCTNCPIQPARNLVYPASPLIAHSIERLRLG